LQDPNLRLRIDRTIEEVRRSMEQEKGRVAKEQEIEQEIHGLMENYI
jgi:hypothetical protein